MASIIETVLCIIIVVQIILLPVPVKKKLADYKRLHPLYCDYELIIQNYWLFGLIKWKSTVAAHGSTTRKELEELINLQCYVEIIKTDSYRYGDVFLRRKD